MRATVAGSPPPFWRRSMIRASVFARKRHRGGDRLARPLRLVEAAQVDVADVARQALDALDAEVAALGLGLEAREILGRRRSACVGSGTGVSLAITRRCLSLVWACSAWVSRSAKTFGSSTSSARRCAGSRSAASTLRATSGNT